VLLIFVGSLEESFGATGVSWSGALYFFEPDGMSKEIWNLNALIRWDAMPDQELCGGRRVPAK
jgi:hypothetical protein